MRICLYEFLIFLMRHIWIYISFASHKIISKSRTHMPFILLPLIDEYLTTTAEKWTWKCDTNVSGYKSNNCGSNAKRFGFIDCRELKYSWKGFFNYGKKTVSEIQWIKNYFTIFFSFRNVADVALLYAGSTRGKLDQISLILFPVSFLLFTIVYWALYLHESRKKLWLDLIMLLLNVNFFSLI